MIQREEPKCATPVRARQNLSSPSPPRRSSGARPRRCTAEWLVSGRLFSTTPSVARGCPRAQPWGVSG
eukprot:1625278-Pyramimonas_sp.AAC.1